MAPSWYGTPKAAFYEIRKTLDEEEVATSTILAMVASVSDATFDEFSNMPPAPSLVQTAMAFRCDSAVFRAICGRTKSAFTMQKAWWSLANTRAPKEFCLHLANCYATKGLETTEDRVQWIAACMHGERRVWFWKEVVAVQLALVQDKSILQENFSRQRQQMPAGVSAYLRTALGLPDDYE